MNQKIPQHVAIVMDGNGRWATLRDLPRSAGHKQGVDVVKLIVQECLKKHIAVLSVWAFGRENWARPVAEVEFLMDLFLQSIASELDELHENGVRLRFTGDRLSLSLALREKMQQAESLTNKNTRLVLNVVMNYSGRWDIVQSAKTLAEQVVKQEISLDDLTEERFATTLNTSGLPDPDLFIRTSGEQRLSNFFLWQLAYAELYFSDVYWPDFTKEEFEKALICFSMRERRFGKTSQQLCEKSDV